MRGQYTATIECTSVTTAHTLMQILAPAAVNVRLVSATVTNISNATNQQQLECLLTRITSGGNNSAGTSVTPTKSEAGDQSSGCTVLGQLTTEPTTYAAVNIDDQGFYSLSSYNYQPMPEARPLIAAATYVGLKLNTAPSASTNFAVEISWIEEG